MNLISIKNFILNTVFPPLCLGCRTNLNNEETNLFLCKKCQNEIKISDKVYEVKFQDFAGTITAGSPVSYQNKVVREIIHSLKYRKITSAKHILTKLTRDYLTQSNFTESLKSKSWVIIPVPIHKSKKAERGFNQSEIIAEILQNELKKQKISSQISKQVLYKVRTTRPQAKLDYESRRKNLQNSMEARIEKGSKIKNIILVDDVITSGSTLEEAVRSLQKYKPQQIHFFTIAKSRPR